MWFRFLFLSQVGFIDQKCSVIPQIVTREWDIRSLLFHGRWVLPAIYLPILRVIVHYITPLGWFTMVIVHSACPQRNRHWRLWTWLHRVAEVPPKNAVTTIPNHQLIIHELPLPTTVKLLITLINNICRNGIVTLLHSSHLQALRGFVPILHSTWHLVRNRPPAQAEDILGLCHSGNNMISTNVVRAGLECSPHHSIQYNGSHFQGHQECW